MEALQKILSEHAKPLGIALMLLISLFIVYYFLGSSLATTKAFSEGDILFELDTGRAINDLARLSGGHDRTSVHPIYVLLANPWGSLLHVLTGSELKAALLLNSFFGATGVSMAFIFFYLYGGRLINSLLLALVFGFSMSQLFLSATPDTASLAICSLLFHLHLIFAWFSKKANSFFLVGGSGYLISGGDYHKFCSSFYLFYTAYLYLDTG